MNKRIRKKWLKKKGAYVSWSEVWNLDYTICEWIIPRLKKFKQETVSYPGIDTAKTPQLWASILDKIIISFEMAKSDPIEEFGKDIKENYQEYCEFAKQYNDTIQEGLELFAKWFNYLWI